MGPNVHPKYEEDLLCPVCKHPLSHPGSPPKPKPPKLGTRGKILRASHPFQSVSYAKETRQSNCPASKSLSKDQEDVVVAQCGHLFHKFCLRHYCYLFREGRSNTFSRATCPVCRRSISMSSAQTILYREHQDHVTDSEKEATKTTLMNSELSDQMKGVQDKLAAVKKSKDEAQQNLDIYRAHLKKIKKDMKHTKAKKADVQNLYAEIEKTDKILAFMQTQHLKIVRKYIVKVKEKEPKDFIHFPRRLAPYLDLIEEDDRLVRDLGEVIMPIHLNHLKSDRQSLLKGILETVTARLAERTETEVDKSAVCKKVTKVEPTLPKSKRPPIFVKVRKSSVSILSTTSLTRESIQKIIETVQAQAPVGMLEQKTAFSNNRVDKVSASDIKIIYMPKRKMVEPVSEPCRAIDASDSCFVRVPPRRCRSTDAILMKQRKKRRKDMLKGLENRGAPAQAEVELATKRSKSAECVNKRREGKVLPILEKRQCSRKPSAVIAILSIPDVKSAREKVNAIREHSRNVKDVTAGDAESPRDDINNNNNDGVKDKDSAKEDYGEQKSSRPESTKDVREKVSVLEMIYHDLKTEPVPKIQMDPCWDDESKRSSPRGKEEINRQEETSSEGLLNTCNWDEVVPDEPPPLQFFRVDKKGNVRPESPYRMCFRQPTFLSSVTDMLSDRSSHNFMAGCLEPDVENQLDKLSPEDRYLLAAEQEAIQSGAGGSAQKRKMLFDLPACMGVPPHNLTTTTTEVTSNQSMPVYLRRWQEHLPSQKYFKADSKPDVPKQVAHCRSARVDTKRSFLNQGRQRQRMGLQQRGSTLRNQGNGKPVEALHLPPLHMFPAKRPSTADCFRAQLGESFTMRTRRWAGAEPLPKIYNFANMSNSFGGINGKM